LGCARVRALPLSGKCGRNPRSEERRDLVRDLVNDWKYLNGSIAVALGGKARTGGAALMAGECLNGGAEPTASCPAAKPGRCLRGFTALNQGQRTSKEPANNQFDSVKVAG